MSTNDDAGKATDDAEIEVHKNCGAPVRSVGEDGISFCESCEHVVEGETEWISEGAK